MPPENLRHPSKPDIGANSPFELFFDQLRDIYSMEVQLGASLPHLTELCVNEGLRSLIGSHAQQNRNQPADLTEIFELHGESPGDDKCLAMAGLIEGGTAHLERVRAPHARDLMMIAHCLRIEYYEMAAYQFATLLAERLGLTREAQILNGLLAEETDMSAALMQLEPELFEIANSPG